MPTACTNMVDAPTARLPVLPTAVSRLVANGAVHGAAVNPPTRPIANAPRGTVAADSRQPGLQAGREVELERAEHRQRQHGVQQADRDDHGRLGQHRREVAAQQREHGAEHGVRGAHPEHVERGQAQRPRPAHVLAAGAEDAQHDRDHRVDARRERRAQARGEGHAVQRQQAPALVLVEQVGVGGGVGGGAGRRAAVGPRQAGPQHQHGGGQRKRGEQPGGRAGANAHLPHGVPDNGGVDNRACVLAAAGRGLLRSKRCLALLSRRRGRTPPAPRCPGLAPRPPPRSPAG
jgi:hypothetical protein